jgi:hypothetical protein
MKQILIIFSATLFLLSCQNQSSSKWTTIKFIQGKPNLVHLNLGDSAHGHGDGMAFEAAIKDTSGVEVGEVLGWLVTVDIVEGDSANPIHVSERLGTMVFNLGDENEIVAQGGTSNHNGEEQMKLGIAHKRAIVGGTGKYKGIAGEVTTTRNEDGTYIHVLDVKMDQ